MKRVAKYLYLREGTYYARFPVPKAMTTQVNHKQIWRSLKTGNKKEAELRLAELMLQYRGWVDKNISPNITLANETSIKFEPDDLVTLADLQSIARDWRKGFLERMAPVYAPVVSGDEHELHSQLDTRRARAEAAKTSLEALELFQKTGRLALSTRWIIEHEMETRNFRLEENDPRYLEFVRYIAQAQFEAYNNELQMLDRPIPKPEHPMFAEDRYIEDEKQAAHSLIRVSKAVEEWLSDPRLNWAPSTLKVYLPRARRIAEALGGSKRISDITREDCEKAAFHVIPGLPARPSQAISNLSISQQVQAAELHGLRTLSPKSVKLHVEVMQQFLNWCLDMEYRADNPARGIKLKVKQKQERQPFTTKQLQSLFDAPVFTGCMDDEKNYRTPGPNIPKRHRFWIPLIALYSGMRLNEICQRHIEDIEEIHGIWTFKVRANEALNQSLKNESSVRNIPIHPKLIQLGFLDYCSAIKATGASRLFPELKGKPDGYGSHAFGKWFSTLLKEQGIKQPSLVFHSLRHSFRDALRETDGETGVQVELGGWAATGVHASYGKGYSTKKLYETLSQIDYPGLDLSRLLAK